MEIIPAIDLKMGKCVRLTQGNFADTRQYSDDPMRVAKRWKEEGATRIHVVDLDGARTGNSSMEHVTLVRNMIHRFGFKVQFGGGIRTADRARKLVAQGIDRVVLGTAAVSDPHIGELFKELGERAVLAVDAIGGMITVDGWQTATKTPAIAFAHDMQMKGARRIIFTDISTDGMMQGPNVQQIAAIRKAVSIPVIASGGIGTLDHIRALLPLGVEGVIVGKALYEGTVKLAEAMALR